MDHQVQEILIKKNKHNYFCFFDPDDFCKNFIYNRLKIFKRNLDQKIIGVYSNVKFLKIINIIKLNTKKLSNLNK